MELKENLSIQEMKKLFNQIIKEEENNYKISIKAFPTTRLEFYQKEILEKGITLVKNKKHQLKGKIINLKEKNNLNIEIIFGEIKQYCSKEKLKKGFKICQKVACKLSEPLFSYGWFEPQTKQIFCILDKYKNNIIIRNNQLEFLIRTAYHEARHRFQEEVTLKQNTYESFMMQIENAIKTSTILSGPDGSIDYLQKHDRYMIEIDANNYSIEKTIEYLKKYPEIYQKNKERLEKLQKEYKQDLKLYDAYSIFEKINTLIKNNPKKVLNKIKLLKIFYKEDGNFKSLSEILKQKSNIDYRIIELILSSNAFLQQLDLNYLSESEQEYITSLLNKTYSTELKRQQKIKDLKENYNLKDYLYQLKISLINLGPKVMIYQILAKKLQNYDKINQQKQKEIISNILQEDTRNKEKTSR